MASYFFILGSHPALSVAEIHAVLVARGIAWTCVTLSEEVFVIECPSEINLDINWFGGVVKWGRIIDEDDMNPTTDFGFSVYRGDTTVSDAVLKEQSARVQKIGMEKKRHAVKAGHPTRYVVSRERRLSSVIVEKELTRHHGTEFVWIVLPHSVLAGITVAVQAFEEYGARDFGRPGHDARSGMLPPKVAQMMVNFAVGSRQGSNNNSFSSSEVEKSTMILDPFCGSGTILQEALLMGHHVIGSDKSPSAIKDSKQNIKWLADNFSISQFPNFQLFQSDVRRVSEKFTTKVDAIVTEPYLGPALRKTPTIQELDKITNELTRLYVDAFYIFETCLKKSGRVCIVFPTFVDNRNNQIQFLSMDVLPAISGWHLVPPFPVALEKHSILRTTPQGMLLYGRPGQKVWREIGILEREA